MLEPQTSLGDSAPSVVALPPEHDVPDDRSLGLDCVSVWGLPLARVTFSETLDLIDRLIARRRPALFITANLHYAALSRRDPRLAAVNRRAAFLLADGMPMVWYSRLIGRPLPQRVAGSDLIYLLGQRAVLRGHRCFLLGAAPGVAEKAGATLLRKYPGLQLVGTEAPSLEQLCGDEKTALIGRIRRARPDLLLVALGQPKGELWLEENLEALGVPACVQVGASFDFVAGYVRRAPRWMQVLCLEWLYRIVREPRRMIPRYFGDTVFLVGAIARDVFRQRK